MNLTKGFNNFELKYTECKHVYPCQVGDNYWIVTRENYSIPIESLTLFREVLYPNR